jgi:sugar phosphate isomerase/epimerase
MPPRLLFSTGSLHVVDIAHCFALAEEAAFDGIEVMCDNRWSTRDPHYLAALAERHRLPPLVLHTPFSARLPGWSRPDDQVGRIEQTLQLAAQLGAETLVVHLPERVWLRRYAVFGRTVRIPQRSGFAPVKRWFDERLQQVQRGTAVRIAVENMPTIRLFGQPVRHMWWNTVPEWSRVHDYLTLDTTHWATHGVEPLDAYRAAGPHVCHVHLSNYDGRQHRLPQRGRLDLGAFLSALAADTFEGTVSVELHPDALGFPDDAAIRRNLRETVAFCREHLAHASTASK